MSQQIQWHIEGMTCAGCAKKVSNFLSKQGLDKVQVDLASGQIDFTIVSEDQSIIGEVKEGLKSLGYHIEGQHQRVWWTLERKLIISALFTVPLMILHFVHIADSVTSYWISLILGIVPITIGFYHFGRSAWAALKHGTVDMDILIFIGGAAAFIYSLIGLALGNPDYNFFETSSSIFTIVLFGNWLEHRVLRKTQSFIQGLKDSFPTTATLIQDDGDYEVDLAKIGIGDIIRVGNGQHVPMDGKIEFGSLQLDESLLTGESDPVIKKKGAEVFSGSVILSGIAEVRVNNLSSQSTMQSILGLVRTAEQSKPSLHRLADRVSSIFVPVVLTISILTFLASHYIFDIPAPQAIMRSIAVLVISCPCALGLATPAAVAVGVNEALKHGILIKRADIMEVLSNVKYFILDKTGTITKPKISIDIVDNHYIDGDKIKNTLAAMVASSTHPLSEALRNNLLNTENIKLADLKSINEIAGKGITAKDNNDNIWLMGSASFTGISTEEDYRSYITRNGQMIAGLNTTEELARDVPQTIQMLRRQGEVILLSGDKKEKLNNAAQQLNILTAIGEVSPTQKLETIQSYVGQGVTAMIGDGINDSAAMTAAHVGISMNDSSKLVANAADVILMGKKFGKVQQLLKISDRTLLNIKQNIFWAFAYNIVAIPLAITGHIDPMWAAIFMALSDVVIIMNAIRFKTMKN